jgi:hypothetical protein
MNTYQIIQALHTAKLYEAAKQQAVYVDEDNLCMLVAVATGVVLHTNALFDVVEALRAE